MADTTAAPDVSALPVDSRSNLASALSGGGLASLAQPAPDISTGGGIGSSASDSNPTGQPPRTVPGVQQIPNQEPMKGLGGRLRGVLYGLATGGIPGAVEGAIAPNLTRTHFQQSEAMRQARTDEAQTEATFSSARAAEAVARASMADFQFQHMDEDRQLAVTQQNLQIAKMAQDAGFQIRAVTSMDQGPEANAQSAMNNIADIKKSDGTIPEMLHLHVGDKVLSLQPINPTAGLNLVNQINRAQGKPTISSDEFLALSKNVQQGMTLDAINFADPGNGVINGDTLSTLQGRLNLIKAQPDFEGKGQLQTILENAVKTHSAVVGYANTRLAQQKAEAENILAPAEASAAFKKSYASAKGQAQGAIAGQMAASGGSTTTGTVDPNTGADEGFLSKLPPQQANIIRGIGEGRIELNARTMASKDGRLLMQQLTTAYPNFDQSKAQSYFATRKDFTSGKTSVGINSYNTAIAHLGTMWDHVSGTNSLQLNNPASTVHRQLDMDKQLVSTELAKAVSNNQMTEKEKNDILSSISGYTVSSYQDRIREAVDLLNGKLESYQQQWSNGAPPGAVTQVRILSPQSERTIAHIKGIGGNGPATRVYQGHTYNQQPDGSWRLAQ